MHLAYVDDSGRQPIRLYGAVIIDDLKFPALEDVAGIVVTQLIPEERRDQFEEFHARDLLAGEGIFEGIDESARLAAIRVLLRTVEEFSLPFVYSAVDVEALAKSPFRTADARDVAFRTCLLGVEDWARSQDGPKDKQPEPRQLNVIRNQCLFLVDDTGDVVLKKLLRASFRQLRTRSLARHVTNRLWHAHDDMYFGDSKDSTGIQISDLCCFVMQQQLRGDQRVTELYKLLKPGAICAKPLPEWELQKAVMRTHEE